VTVDEFMDGRGEHAREVRRVKFKLASKIAALEFLGKHHKLYTDRETRLVRSAAKRRFKRA
jgi:phage terminase small subunit